MKLLTKFININVFIGLVRGVGLGVVGFVAQPATGVIDFASGSLQAFNNVIDSKQVATPMRPTRSFNSSPEITPYNIQTAYGKFIFIFNVLNIIIFT